MRFACAMRSVFRRLFEEKGAAVSDERLADTARLFRALSYRRAPRPIKGARRTLDELRRRGAKLYLLSNAQSCFTVPELQLLGLADAFDGIFLSSDFGCRKPSPAFFRAALERAGVLPLYPQPAVAAARRAASRKLPRDRLSDGSAEIKKRRRRMPAALL